MEVYLLSVALGRARTIVPRSRHLSVSRLTAALEPSRDVPYALETPTERATFTTPLQPNTSR
jgi:hypothetical protein